MQVRKIEKQTLTRATAVIILATVFSRLSGFLRETVIAYRFGATAEVDAFLVALIIPLILFNFINLGIQNTFIPVYSPLKNKKSAPAFFSAAFLLLAVILLLLAAFFYLLAPALVSLVAPGFSGETYRLTVTLSRILIPGLISMGLAGLMTGYHHSHSSFFQPAFSFVWQNSIIIFSALFLATGGMVPFTRGVLLGIAALSLSLIPGVFKLNLKLIRPDFTHPGIKQMAILLPPIVLGGAALELKNIIDRTFASFLPAGSVAALNYANRLYQLPLGLFIFSLIAVLFPTLVELADGNKQQQFKAKFEQSFRVILFFSLPVVAGLIILRQPLVSLLFERGAFDATATQKTAYALLFYSFGLVTVGLRELFNRAFFALKDTRTPMLATLLTVFLNILLNFILMPYLAHGGIALATSLAAGAGALLLYFLLRRRTGVLADRENLFVASKLAAATFVMSLYLWLILGYINISGETLPDLLRLSFLIGSSFIVYFAVVLLLKVKESREALATLFAMLVKLWEMRKIKREK